MQTRNGKRIFAAFLTFAVLLGIVYWVRNNAKEPQSPTDHYYTGAFHSKGDPSKCVTEDGKVVPCPNEPAPPGVQPSKNAP